MIGIVQYIEREKEIVAGAVGQMTVMVYIMSQS